MSDEDPCGSDGREDTILEFPKNDIHLERIDSVLEYIQACTDETGENEWEYFRMHLEHKAIELRVLYKVWRDAGYE